jgi:hopanoid biosynthesis associated protein HpnK
MKRLIVNADDLGLTAGVNQGILDAHHYGGVTSASLMANGEAFEEAVAMSRRAPRLSVGVHLNLTQGIPVSPPSAVPSLVDARGRLYLAPGRLLCKLLTRRINLCEIELELQEQIVKVLRAGIIPTHLDGHKHVHILPGVSEIVIRLAQEFGIPSVRCPLEEFPMAVRLPPCPRDPQTSVLKQYLVGRAVSWFARRFRLRLSRAGLISPTHFFGLSETGFLNAETLESILERLPEGVSELMCHPGYANSRLKRTGTRLLAQRVVEIRALGWLRSRLLVVEEGIQLISYDDLVGKVSEPGKAIRELEVLQEA